jgi:hypothetical protein
MPGAPCNLDSRLDFRSAGNDKDARPSSVGSNQAPTASDPVHVRRGQAGESASDLCSSVGSKRGMQMTQGLFFADGWELVGVKPQLTLTSDAERMT